MKTIRSEEQLQDILLSSDKNCSWKIISLDVFDTLLFRKVAPDTIVQSTSRFLSSELERYGIYSAVDRLRARDIAYRKVAESYVRKEQSDLECHLDEFTYEWVRSVIPDGNADVISKITKNVIRFEIESEIASVYPNPFFLRLLPRLKSRFRIIVTSDMYLGWRYIQRLLEQAGFPPVFDAFYVSGDHRLLKRTARLFTKLIEVEGVNPSDICHIGDNSISDGSMPNQLGVNSIVFQTQRCIQRIAEDNFNLNTSCVSPSWDGYTVARIAGLNQADSGSVNYQAGFKYLGPLLSHFVHRLFEKSRAEGIRDLFFFSREGYLLKRLFDEQVTQWEHFHSRKADIRAHYLGVSRLTTLGASTGELGFREVGVCLKNVGFTSIRAFVKALQVPEDILNTALVQAEFLNPEAPLGPDFWFSPSFYRFADALRPYLREAQAQKLKLITEYFSQIGLISPAKGPIGVVDIGWSANIQESIHRILGTVNHDAPVYGFYLGCKADAYEKTSKNFRVFSLLANEGDRQWFAHSVFDFVQVLENLIRAPHPTIIGYQRWSDGQIYPVSKSASAPSRSIESKDDAVIHEFQLGCIDFNREYCQATHAYQIPSENTRAYALISMERFALYPPKAVASNIIRLSNISDMGSDESYSLGTGRSDVLWLRRLFRAFFRSSFGLWRSGSIVNLDLPIALEYSHIRFGLRVANNLSKSVKFNRPFLRIASESPPARDEAVHNDERVIIDGQLVEIGELFRSLTKTVQINRLQGTPDFKQQLISARELAHSRFVLAIINLILRFRRRPRFHTESVSLKHMFESFLLQKRIRFKLTIQSFSVNLFSRIIGTREKEVFSRAKRVGI